MASSLRLAALVCLALVACGEAPHLMEADLTQAIGGDLEIHITGSTVVVDPGAGTSTANPYVSIDARLYGDGTVSGTGNYNGHAIGPVLHMEYMDSDDSWCIQFEGSRGNLLLSPSIDGVGVTLWIRDVGDGIVAYDEATARIRGSGGQPFYESCDWPSRQFFEVTQGDYKVRLTD